MRSESIPVVLAAMITLVVQRGAGAGSVLPAGDYEPAEIEVSVIRAAGANTPSDTVIVRGSGEVLLACPDSAATSEVSSADVARLVRVLCREEFFNLRGDYTWHYLVSSTDDGAVRVGHIESTTGDSRIEIRVRIGELEKAVVSYGGPRSFDAVLTEIETIPSVHEWREAMYAKAVR